MDYRQYEANKEVCAACGKSSSIYFSILLSREEGGGTPSICFKCEQEWRGGVPPPKHLTHEVLIAEAESLRAFIKRNQS